MVKSIVCSGGKVCMLSEKILNILHRNIASLESEGLQVSGGLAVEARFGRLYSLRSR